MNSPVSKLQISLSTDIKQTMFKVVQESRIILRNVKSCFDVEHDTRNAGKIGIARVNLSGNL